MIGATKRLLIETLLNLALGEEINTEAGDLPDHIRAIFLLVSSHSIVELPHVERISYESYEDYETGVPRLVSGIAVPESGMLLSDIVQNLMYLEKIPDEIARNSPHLKFEDFQAALYAINCITVCLQWDEALEPHEKRYSPEVAQQRIRRSLRSLRNYRETGEP